MKDVMEVNRLALSKDEYLGTLNAAFQASLQGINKKWEKLVNEVKELIKKEEIIMVDGNILDVTFGLVFPSIAEQLDMKKTNYIYANTSIEKKLQASPPLLLGRKNRAINYENEREIAVKRIHKDINFLCTRNGNDYCKCYSYYGSCSSSNSYRDNDTALIPVAQIPDYKRDADFIIDCFVKRCLCPKDLTAVSKELLCELIWAKQIFDKYISYDDEIQLSIDWKKVSKREEMLLCKGIMYLSKRYLTVKEASKFFDIIENQQEMQAKDKNFRLDVEEYLNKEEAVGSLLAVIEKMILLVNDVKTLSVSVKETKEKLLNCEKVRADIEPYEERILTDPNRGHWDLWEDKEAEEKKYVSIDESLFARNPKVDINEEGVIAIDFGTKSTVVVYQGKIEHPLPMGIGDGNISAGVTKSRYENPTVMHFVDLKTFLTDYQSAVGRPDTKWADLPISHTAMDKLEHCKSEEYYAFLYQIKQWAGSREKQYRIKDMTGNVYTLPSFMELKDTDFNPIEVYAYYIGLYINNMRNGIFLDYYLSFPVTYEKRIREKIIKSFERGLKKSLPEVVLQDEEIMKDFRVNGEVSEPAAYAVCALQEYGFDPEEGEEIFYGIFDFGGGTTDFDFGLWRKSSKRRFDYTIETFGANGDEYLGGENLLEMVAFEIFKSNQETMRKQNCCFTLAPKCKEFVGSDALLSDSQEAEKNMSRLMEAVRPYWENSASKNETGTQNGQGTDNIDNGFIKIDLFNRAGVLVPNIQLRTSREFIQELIEKRIKEGIDNFFTSWLLSYQNNRVKKPTKVHIFLAGNSCKSPIVKRLFEQEMENQKEKIRQRFPEHTDIDNIFELFPPLGTTEALEKMQTRGIDLGIDISKEENSTELMYERPTGKTGVAFGLLQCKEGGVIERLVHLDNDAEIDFQYFLGWQSAKKFKLFKDETCSMKYKGKPDYNKWYQFIEADLPTFYLYYTTLPECVNGNMSITEAKMKKCKIDDVNEDAFVYIRAKTPHTLEYTVMTESEAKEEKAGKIYTLELE